MGTTRKAPSGPKHARCVHHEAYATAPAGWLCFADASAPTDDAILERMVWADEIEAIRAEHRRQWAERAEPDGLFVRTQSYCAHDVPQIGAYTVHAGHPSIRFEDERYSPSGQYLTAEEDREAVAA